MRFLASNDLFILRSPCLRSLSVAYKQPQDFSFRRPSDLGWQDMAMYLVRSVPNLENFSIEYYQNVDVSALSGPINSISGWGGVRPPASEPAVQAIHRAKLRSLSINFNDVAHFADPYHLNLGLSLLVVWETVTDFAYLRRLVLSLYLRKNTVDWLHQHYDVFSSLEALKLSVLPCDFTGGNPWIWGQPEKPSTQSLISFISAIKPLREFDLDLLTLDLLDPVLQRHGPSLTKLRLSVPLNVYGLPVPQRAQTGTSLLGHHEVIRIRDACPNLEELDIPTRRSIADAGEVAIYRALGTIPRLHTLHLCLGFDKPDPDPTWDAWAVTPYTDGSTIANGELRAAFQHCAVDSNLALSIWEAIRSGSRPQSLSLRNHSIALFDLLFDIRPGDNPANRFRLCNSYEFMVSTSPGAGPLKMVTHAHGGEDVRRGNEGPLEGVLQRTWQTKPGREGWWDSWESIPLPRDSA